MAKNVKIKDLNVAVSKIGIIKKQAEQIAKAKLEKEKASLINSFLEHPVSKEISGGASASNSSGTLSGYGNLFSFIGFSSGSRPVEEWVQILKNKIKIVKSTQNTAGDKITYSFEVRDVNNDLSIARMPWEGGRSWITSIERGISGFSFYVSKALGRSGGGIQSNNSVRSGNYSPVQYWSKMWQDFTKNLNK